MIYLDGPEEVKKFGPIEIDFHTPLGFSFFIFGRNVNPKRFSPLWIIARILYPDKFGGK